MKITLSLFLLLGIIIGALTKRHNNAHRHTLHPYQLSKLNSITQWLDGRQDSTIFDYIFQINRGAGLNLYQGDIKGYRPKHTRLATRERTQLWNTRVVPYEFDHDFDANSRQYVLAAFEEYHKHTCIRFKPRTTEKDYLHFAEIQGCYSDIGRSGGMQDISLMGGCLRKGTAMHEIMHALGFFHEQSRPDRDSWIQVIYTNIIQNKKFNFDKQPSDQVDTLGIQYDYGSIMHYSKTAFSKNSNPTILPIRQTNADIGQRDGFSDKDIQKINKLYRCSIPAPTNQTPVTTQRPSGITPTTIHPTLHPLPTTTQTIITQPPYGWTSWASWSPCSLSCVRKRYRFCLNYDSSLCPGNDQQVENCPSPCKDATYVGCYKFNITNPTIASVEGSDPSLSDPYKARVEPVRKCADYASQHGYIVFAILDDGKCLTSHEAYKEYSKEGASNTCGSHGKGGVDAMSVYTFQKNIDGQWSEWTDYGQCTRSCGGGYQYRYRFCNNPLPMGNGSRCLGKDVEQKSCNNDSCKANTKCGSRFYTGDAGTFGIINVNDYDNYMQCDYSIKAANNVTISVLITRIDIEYSAGCVFDALMVFDGSDTQSKLAGSYCGNLLPHAVLSSTDEIFIRFESDSTSTGTGFTIYYTINSHNRKTCITPGAVAHATVTYTTNFVGDDATYQCEAGYSLVGPSGVTCLDQPKFAVWSDMFPICVRNFRRKRSFDLMIRACSFEKNLCGYTEVEDDEFDWVLSEPMESMDNQKPKLDNKNTTRGQFLFAETSRLQNLGDRAIITSKPYHTAAIQEKCLSFWLYTFGTDTSSFSVKIIEDSAVATPPVWSTEVDDNVEWREIKINIFPKQTFEIQFEYVVGDGFGSSAAIDDVMVTSGRC